ncbi:glycosyltransferase [Nocardia sp. alder85J]|uniref:glycosyltransferase n=1 Tax=Nocardia sp. alder85J TaxID=2862949 RepID=UPI001CD43BB3|nr:glycosyltransferase family 2 protein [Nocardia sp. alder85J]MCX4092611.1 glycosyltransferase family 2 protein [Nocardia sp. alder85J]
MHNPDTPIVLSVVVPALDEATAIVATLDRLVAQQAVDEVIVVDNGSTDGTQRIVRDYQAGQPKVVLVEESRRGVAQARNTGLDAARGDFIARTDADTRVAENWGAVIRGYFTEHPDTAALTGLTTYYDSPVGFLLKLGYRIQIRRGKLGGQVGNMHGPNMAVRRTAWQQVREDTSTRPDVIDDLDLALCLCKRGLRIDQLLDMLAETSARRRHTSPRRWWDFQLSGLRTIQEQGLQVLPYHRFFVVMAWFAHTVQWPLYRCWDFDRRRFTLRRRAARAFPLARPS